jgi:hypothetical protein
MLSVSQPSGPGCLRALGDQQCNGVCRWCGEVGPYVEDFFAARKSSIGGAEKDLPEHEDSVPRDFAVCVDDEAVRRRKESKEMIWRRALCGRAELVKGDTEAAREGAEVGSHVGVLSLQPLVDGHQDRLLKLLSRLLKSST